MRGFAQPSKHVAKSVLIGVASFVATSSFIVTFAVMNAVQAPRTPSYELPREYTPKSQRSSTADAGVGAQPRSSDASDESSAIADPPSSPGASEDLTGDVADDISDGVGVELPTDRILDPALISLLGSDVPETLAELVPPAKNLPQLELTR